MLSIVIKKGGTESEPFILANKELATVFAPAFEDLKVTLKGGYEVGSDLGKIYKDGSAISFFIQKDVPTVHTFDSDDFEGIMVLSFSVENALNEDLELPVYLKAF